VIVSNYIYINGGIIQTEHRSSRIYTEIDFATLTPSAQSEAVDTLLKREELLNARTPYNHGTAIRHSVMVVVVTNLLFDDALGWSVVAFHFAFGIALFHSIHVHE
jgi:hypothetical protein